MTLREFLAIMRHRWMTIAASALVVLAATAAATLMMTPVYTASARVYFSTEAPVDEVTGEPGGFYVLTLNDLSTYIEVLNSPTVIEAIKGEVGEDAVFTVSATTSGMSAILNVTATSPDPEIAAEVANVAGPELAAVAPEFSALLASAGQTVESTFISPAAVPGSPSSPDVGRNLALGLVIGIVAGIGVAFIQHGFDTRVRGEADLQQLSDRPVLANIPFDKHADKRPIIMDSQPHSPHAEEYRRLRANLLFVDVEKATHSFVITSAMPSEGKTTTAINLAIAMADAGSRVLLIDADLRNPSVAKTMALDGDAGLTTMLIGRATFDDVAQQWKDTSLWVLPAGPVPPNPSELLGSNAMARLFGQLSEQFDFVLVDSPPVAPVIDAVLLDKLTGGTVLVVSLDRIRKRFLAHALKSLSTAGAQVSGFALNMVPMGSDSYYGYGYHGYGAPGASSGASPAGRATTRRDAARVAEASTEAPTEATRRGKRAKSAPAESEPAQAPAGQPASQPSAPQPPVPPRPAAAPAPAEPAPPAFFDDAPDPAPLGGAAPQWAELPGRSRS